MIIVMPDAYWNQAASLDLAGPRSTPPPGVGGGSALAAANPNAPPPPPTTYEKNEQQIVGDMIPFVDKNYRTLADRDDRALAGLSMGSAITTNVAVKRTDMFGSIGILSAGIFTAAKNSVGGTKVFDQINPDFLKDPAATNKKIKLLFFTCGTEDPCSAGLRQTWSDLKGRKLNFVAKTYPGEHEWKVWRHSLVDMAQLLFK